MAAKTIYRVTGIFLSSTIALLGVTVAVLLYYAGQEAILLFYTDSTYRDEHLRIHKRLPTDNWYGELVLKGWAFGFIYVVPGLSGITASLFFNRFLTVLHVILTVLAVFVGSFLHTGGCLTLIIYRLLVVEGASRYNPWLSDCIYTDINESTTEDKRCLTGHRALALSIAAICVAFVGWIFLLAETLYTGFIFHNIGKSRKTQYTVQDTRLKRPRNRRRASVPVPSTVTETSLMPTDHVTTDKHDVTTDKHDVTTDKHDVTTDKHETSTGKNNEAFKDDDEGPEQTGTELSNLTDFAF